LQCQIASEPRGPHGFDIVALPPDDILVDVDGALDESFPASDPPSWTLGGTRQAPPPVGSVLAPLPCDGAAPSTGVSAGTRVRELGQRLARQGPLLAASVGALGSLALTLAGRRAPGRWLLQASSWVLLLAIYRQLTRRQA
jgi:hypothetical protein